MTDVYLLTQADICWTLFCFYN